MEIFSYILVHSAAGGISFTSALGISRMPRGDLGIQVLVQHHMIGIEIVSGFTVLSSPSASLRPHERPHQPFYGAGSHRASEASVQIKCWQKIIIIQNRYAKNPYPKSLPKKAPI